MSEKDLIAYYNKFCEDKRLLSRHGQVEFSVAMHFIKKYLSEFDVPKIIDIGAGTGRYSYMLAELGCDVTAVELVKYNLGVLKSKGRGVKAVQGDARNLKKFADGIFDVALLFGPMYHLLSHEDKVRALLEAKRVVRPGGLIFISYLMNDYALIIHGFKDGNILDAINTGRVDESYRVVAHEDDLYSYVRLEDINNIAKEVGLKRELIVAQDGAADYMRDVLNKMNDEEFGRFIDYQISIAARPELLGASSHVLDILRVD